MTPQELIDLPFAGMAEKKLKQDNQWDEWAGMPYSKYSIRVSGTVYTAQSEVYSISARSDEEAELLAGDKFKDNYPNSEVDETTVLK